MAIHVKAHRRGKSIVKSYVRGSALKGFESAVHKMAKSPSMKNAQRVGKYSDLLTLKINEGKHRLKRYGNRHAFSIENNLQARLLKKIYSQYWKVFQRLN